MLSSLSLPYSRSPSVMSLLTEWEREVAAGDKVNQYVFNEQLDVS